MSGRRILIVEDDEDLRYLWTDALSGRGHKLISVGDGAEALARLPRFQPDLILLDFIMPRAEVDGLLFLQRLNDRPGLTTAPIIVISGLGEPLAAKIAPETASSLRIAAILAKPIAMTTLFEEVDRALATS